MEITASDFNLVPQQITASVFNTIPPQILTRIQNLSNAQNKVTNYLQKFMDGSGWFHDSPIPQDVRVDVDGPLKNLYGVLAEDLKEALLIWDIKTNPPEASLFFDTLRAFSAGMQAAEEISQQYVDTMKTLVHGASRVGLGFVPFVGPAIDICEAVTGKEFCLPSGRTLTTGERVFSGLGFGIGKVVKVWKGISSAAISSEGKAVAAGIAGLGDDVIKLFKERYVRKWRGGIANGGLEYLGHGDVGELYKFANYHEPKALLRMLQDDGQRVLGPSDVIVRKLLDIPENSPIKGVSKACDFLTISKTDGLILSEVKGAGAKGGRVDIPDALQQLDNVMKALTMKNLEGSVERVQIFVPKNAAFKLGFIRTSDGRLQTQAGAFVSPAGRPDLIVRVLEL